MKYLFRTGMKIYEVNLGKELIEVKNQDTGENLFMNHSDFRKFVRWMGEELQPSSDSIDRSETQQIDLFDFFDDVNSV